MRNRGKLSVVLLVLVALYWPGIQYHWELAKDPYFIPFDAVQYIPAFFKFQSSDPIPTTYVKEYYLSAICPLLYKWLLSMGSRFFDVHNLQLAIMYLAYGVFLVALGRLGWLLGGAPLCFAVVALTVTARLFIGWGFIGGAPRMFAYPLIALILYSLILDRPYLLAITIVFGGLLYPIVAIIGGGCLCGWMLLRPLFGRGCVSHWGLSRRLCTLVLTGTLTVAAIAPLLTGSQPYGRRVVESDITNYPEAGPEGNYRPFDRLPYQLFGGEWISYYIGPLYSHSDPLVPSLSVHENLNYAHLQVVLAATSLAILAIILVGMVSMLKTKECAVITRVIGFFVTCAILHLLAWLASPYLYIPTRYFMFSLPFLITLFFPWSLYVLLSRTRRLQSSPRLRDISFLAIICLYLIAFGGRGNVDLLAFSGNRSTTALFDEIEKLPNDVLIAGWPIGVLQQVEYVARRNVFLTADLHQVLHTTYMQLMRTRMDALFDAYLSTEDAPVNRLRQEFGVTHLIVNLRHFTDPTRPPEYFAPWRSRISPRLAEIRGQEYLLNHELQKRAAVFDQNELVLLDLTKVPQSKAPR